MSEVWRPVPGWEGWYAVSDHGRVRAEQRTISRTTGYPYTRRQRLMKPVPVNRSRHLRVHLSRQNQTRDVFVHVLVLEAFVSSRPAGMQACHADGDPANNALTNLRWDTQSANALDSVAHGSHPWARRTHCPAGHPYDQSNTEIRARGGRRCRACSRTQDAARRARMKEARP